jgi:hypothetical protein
MQSIMIYTQSAHEGIFRKVLINLSPESFLQKQVF